MTHEPRSDDDSDQDFCDGDIPSENQPPKNREPSSGTYSNRYRRVKRGGEGIHRRSDKRNPNK